MKKNALFILTLMTMLLTLIFMFGCIEYGTNEDDYLRIHIRANSNLPCDQEVKLAVRDSLVQYLSPLLSEARTREEAEKIRLRQPGIRTGRDRGQRGAARQKRQHYRGGDAHQQAGAFDGGGLNGHMKKKNRTDGRLYRSEQNCMGI